MWTSVSIGVSAPPHTKSPPRRRSVVSLALRCIVARSCSSAGGDELPVTSPEPVWPAMDNRAGAKVLSDSLLSDGLLDWGGVGDGPTDGREKGQRESEADKETPLAVSAASDDMFSVSAAALGLSVRGEA